MGMLLDVGEIAGVPPAGKRTLLLDASGVPYLLGSDGVHNAIGSGAIPDDTITAAMLNIADKAAITAFMNTATNLLPGLMPAAAFGGSPTVAALLTDANATITPKASRCGRYVLPGPLTADRVLTITDAEGDNTDVVQITVLDTSAFKYTIQRSTGPTTLYEKLGGQDHGRVYQLFHTGGIWQPNIQYWAGG